MRNYKIIDDFTDAESVMTLIKNSHIPYEMLVVIHEHWFEQWNFIDDNPAARLAYETIPHEPDWILLFIYAPYVPLFITKT